MRTAAIIQAVADHQLACKQLMDQFRLGGMNADAFRASLIYADNRLVADIREIMTT